MTVQAQIKEHIDSMPEAKAADMKELQGIIQKIIPKSKLWYLDGKNEEGRSVTNPNVGYGSYTIHYKDGTSREFYQVGFSANTSGLSLYIMGIDDRKFLPDNYSKRIGKAKVTGYCINFKTLKEIDTAVLEEAIRAGLEFTKGK